MDNIPVKRLCFQLRKPKETVTFALLIKLKTPTPLNMLYPAIQEVVKIAKIKGTTAIVLLLAAR
jgi:hypothetical protein